MGFSLTQQIQIILHSKLFTFTLAGLKESQIITASDLIPPQWRCESSLSRFILEVLDMHAYQNNPKPLIVLIISKLIPFPPRTITSTKPISQNAACKPITSLVNKPHQTRQTRSPSIDAVKVSVIDVIIFISEDLGDDKGRFCVGFNGRRGPAWIAGCRAGGLHFSSGTEGSCGLVMKDVFLI